MIVEKPVPNDEGWIPIRNSTGKGYELTDAAIGLLVRLLSYPSGWEVNVDKISAEAKRANKKSEGRDARRRAMRELEEAGYIERVRRQDEQGRWVTVCIVRNYENRHTENQASVDQSSDIQASSLRRSNNKVINTALHSPVSGRFAPSDGGATDRKDQKASVDWPTNTVPRPRASYEDWRGPDWYLFKDIVGDGIESDGTGGWKQGSWNADVWYEVLQRAGKKPIDWPGKYFKGLQDTRGLEGWLAYRGLALVD